MDEMRRGGDDLLEQSAATSCDVLTAPLEQSVGFKVHVYLPW